MNPGPSAYNTESPSRYAANRIATMVFGTSKRPPLQAPTIVPGPGNYSVPSKGVEGKLISMLGSRPKAEKSTSPGPGEYS